MVQFKGVFEATLANVIEEELYIDELDNYKRNYVTENYVTDVEYDLCPQDDESYLTCTFCTLKGEEYTFNTTLFSNSAFKYLHRLIHARFGKETDVFGKIVEGKKGNSMYTEHIYSLENVINARKYSLQELFICIKQIVETHLEKTLIYCHLQSKAYEALTYEEYIHNAACELIISSEYYRDFVFLEKDKVEFIDSNRDFMPQLLEN